MQNETIQTETKEQKSSPVPERLLPLFCQEMYQLYRSGVTPADALELLEEDETDLKLRETFHAAAEGMRDGLPLANALRATGAFPAYLTDTAALADETGKLEESLLGLQRYYERRIRMREELRNAATVPAALLVVMAAVVVLLVTRVLPVFDRVFAQMGVRMGGLAAGMMRVGVLLADAGTWIAVFAALLAAAAAVTALVPSLRERFTGWFLYRYGGRGIAGQLRTARFASAMAMASASGMGMDEASELSAKLCAGTREIDGKIAAFRGRIQEGDSPADALAACGLFSRRDCRLLKLAERTGSLPETLEGLADRMQEENLRRLDRLVGMIEPGIVLFTSLLSGVILLYSKAIKFASPGRFRFGTPPGRRQSLSPLSISVMLPMTGLLFGMG